MLIEASALPLSQTANHLYAEYMLKESQSAFCHSISYTKIRMVGLPEGEKQFEDVSVAILIHLTLKDIVALQSK